MESNPRIHIGLQFENCYRIGFERNPSDQAPKAAAATKFLRLDAGFAGHIDDTASSVDARSPLLHKQAKLMFGGEQVMLPNSRFCTVLSLHVQASDQYVEWTSRFIPLSCITGLD
ncbi:hypothetical protein FNV43_RR16271 [Rhamnella rubrinervis]|uniref:Uncharacterized protein n=1 Tax=Rhamnella rubrinervis TaxID=2594499 RepID=A0A8K0E396_9ROSA|nr:hypothetical protein FNV43_RR16271 [Rhamnella rubrinervis]